MHVYNWFCWLLTTFYLLLLQVTVTVLYNADQFEGTQWPFQGWKELLSLCVVNQWSMSLGTKSKLAGIVLQIHYNTGVEFWKGAALVTLAFSVWLVSDVIIWHYYLYYLISLQRWSKIIVRLWERTSDICFQHPLLVKSFMSGLEDLGLTKHHHINIK